MTRFKELRRIEAAVEHQDKAQLRRAAEYCKMRLQIATRKDHQKYWQKMERKVLDALESSK